MLLWDITEDCISLAYVSITNLSPLLEVCGGFASLVLLSIFVRDTTEVAVSIARLRQLECFATGGGTTGLRHRFIYRYVALRVSIMVRGILMFLRLSYRRTDVP